MGREALGGAVIAAMLMAGASAAQVRTPGPGAGYGVPGARPVSTGPATRWGSKVGGHWWGGVNAPGGWSAYRRPARGYLLPRYWVAPRFYINDWRDYGLAQPPAGYGWSRYYDDAVLVDARGSVYDSVSGVDWDGRYDGYVDTARDGGYDYRGPDDRGVAGLGGAAVGAVAGGVAGNLIAGRGNRLGGTLIGAGIGAGVGAAAGYAIDRSSDRRDRVRPPVVDYPPRARDRDHDVPPPPFHDASERWVSPDGSTTVVTTRAGGGYGAGSTVVTVQTAPVVTTTTTTTYEDAVTYRPAGYRVAKVYRKRWVKSRCGCR